MAVLKEIFSAVGIILTGLLLIMLIRNNRNSIANIRKRKRLMLAMSIASIIVCICDICQNQVNLTTYILIFFGIYWIFRCANLSKILKSGINDEQQM